jgi:serine/threonine protein kinase
VTWAYVEHANILPFRGVCAGADIKNTIFTIVTPWVQQDLDDYVQGPHYRANYGRLYLTLVSRSVIKIRPKLMCQKAKALASGLAYLHAQKFVHGDVKAVSGSSSSANLFDDHPQSNIRVRDDGTLLLADFGHAIVGDITRGSYTGTGSVSSNGWQAPEACDSTSKKRTSAMDVYGYGCVCYMVRMPYRFILYDTYQVSVSWRAETRCSTTRRIERQPKS